MTEYFVSFAQPQHRFLDVRVRIPVWDAKKLKLQLASWRPGRYELGNFAKNVRAFSVKDQTGNAVPYSKINKDSWEVLSSGCDFLEITYQYYSADLNAGSTFVDQSQLYVNPVNCMIYVPDRIEDEAIVNVTVPSGWELASGIRWSQQNGTEGKNVFQLFPGSFHELADSPFILSPHLKHHEFRVGEYNFHIWFQGECRPDWDRIIRDFTAFTSAQVRAYGEFPVKTYHFLVQILPVPFYHGVEHLTSSINAIGPGYELMRDRYDDLLGLCSHELYHAWNIKSIRPAEMWPYDYTRENYFRTGYVAEGVTTYMGDYFLLASGVFTLQNYLAEFSAQVQKHMDNFGRRNYSVSESSWDTWLDGYVPGIPERKVSIYTEGCLLAFMADIQIMMHSKNVNRLHQVMHSLYHQFYKKGKGYSPKEYRALVEQFAGAGLCEYFDTLVNGKNDYLPLLKTCLDYIGLQLTDQDPATTAEKRYGLRIQDAAGGSQITAIHPDEPAYACGLAIGDKVIAVNGYQVNNDSNKWIAYFGGEELNLTIQRNGDLKKVAVPLASEGGFRMWKVVRKENLTNAQEENYKKWSLI